MKRDDRYSNTAIALHWITALLIVGNLLLGLSMVALPISPRKLHWYVWHKSIGATVFALACVRLAWRASHAAPPAVPVARWQQRAAAVSHVALYLLLLITPLSGWVYSSATGVQVVYLGLIPLPDVVPKDKALATLLKLVHVALNSTLFVLVIIHAAAALKHHFVDHDATLRRMLPRWKGKWAAR